MICRQCISVGLLAAIVLGCSNDAPPVGAVGHVRAYYGGLAADEPEAAVIARDVLSAGGSAVDAVVSMGLGMMVTRPDAAGPGGGGMCVVFDAAKGLGEAIEFLPHAPKSQAPSGQWLAAVPGSFRGLFALHARYGLLRWEQLVLPAERLARFGVRIPRVVTKVLEGPARSAIKGSRGRAMFFDVAGMPLREGDVLRQVDLAATLARIRIAGPGEFYSGSLARNFVDGVQGAGGWLTVEDMRSYRPKWMKARSGRSGPNEVYFIPAPATGGEVAANIWNMQSERGYFTGLFSEPEGIGELPVFLAAARQGYTAALATPREQAGSASAGVLAVDRLGNSAACVLTMDRPFGAGRVAGDTGVMPVQPARAGALLALSAMIVANPNTKQSFLAATGTGDQFASSAMTEVVLRVLKGKMAVEPALRAARAAAAESAGVLVEPALPAAAKAVLGAKGGQLREVPRIGQVNVMSCPDGIVDRPETCAVDTDPRGYGLAINAEL